MCANERKRIAAASSILFHSIGREKERQQTAPDGPQLVGLGAGRAD